MGWRGFVWANETQDRQKPDFLHDVGFFWFFCFFGIKTIYVKQSNYDAHYLTNDAHYLTHEANYLTHEAETSAWPNLTSPR